MKGDTSAGTFGGGPLLRTRSTSSPRRFAGTDEDRTATIVALVAIGLQFAAFCTIATLVVSRLSLTMDMLYHAQPMHLIGRGILDPFVFGGSSQYRYRYDHGAFLTWAFAPFTRVFPAPVVLDGVNVIAGAGASWFVWLVIAAEARTLPTPFARWTVRVVGLALVVFDPWPYWANAFDYHPHGTAVVFVCGAIYFGYRRSAVPCVAMIACVALLGDVTSTYAAALGFGLLFRRGVRLAGLCGIVLAVAEFALVAHMRPHDIKAPRTGSFYAYLLDPAQRADPSSVEFGAVVAAALHHPDRLLAELWLRRANGWASISPAGVLGVFHPLTAAVVVMVLLESLLAGPPGFSQPGFQIICAYPTIALGTTLLLVRLIRRNPRAGAIVAAVLVANVAGWGATFAPLLTRHWLYYSGHDAARLDSIRREVPTSHQVVAAQGAVGAFADRHDIFFEIKSFLKYGAAEPTDIIITPYAGLNIDSTDYVARGIGWWIFAQHAKLVSVEHDVWHLALPSGPTFRSPVPKLDAGAVPAWALREAAGTRVIGATGARSYMRGSQRPGYVVSGAIDNLSPGAYRVSARVAGSGTFYLEVYDRDTRTFISRTAIRAPRRVADVVVDVDVPDGEPSRESLDGGNAIFGFKPYNAHLGYTEIELRIYEPGHRRLDVYSLDTTRR